MRTPNRRIRKTASLRTNIAAQLRSMEDRRVEKQKEQRFVALAERFRTATGPEAVKRFGDDLGRMVFGGLR
jgi:hypothetical protein